MKGLVQLQKFLGMAVVDVVDNINAQLRDPRINWTPESRKTLKEMLEAGVKLKTKLEKLGFDMRPLPPFEEGDQDEFLTKES